MLQTWHVFHILFVRRCKINSECVTDGLQLVHMYIIVHAKNLPKLCSYMYMWFIADHMLSQLQIDRMQVCYILYLYCMVCGLARVQIHKHIMYMSSI